MSATPKRKRPEEAEDFLERIIRMAAARASMASWGQPFEAIASWFLLAKGRGEPPGGRRPPDEHNP